MNMNAPIGASIDDADVLAAQVIALAVKHEGNPEEILSLKDAVEFLADRLGTKIVRENENHDAELAIFRAALRSDCLISSLVEGGQTSFYGEFCGSGDSGNYEPMEKNTAVNRFLEYMVQIHVHFDWYNNDGGGGDITWYVTDDVVTINGYQNVTTTESVMLEEEF